MREDRVLTREGVLGSLRLCLPIRDLSQSENGNVLDLAHPVLLREFYPLVGEFNHAGSLQIDAIETPCGAQPQVDVFRGRRPLETMRQIDAVLCRSVAARILVRGPYGVGLEPLAVEDLYFMLREMAVASGARDGRRVVFKLFEAQNSALEKGMTYRLVSLLSEEGLDVGLEDAICFTAEPALDTEYYRSSLRASLRVGRGSSLSQVVSAVGLKDMIGGLRGLEGAYGVEEYADAARLVEVLARVSAVELSDDCELAIHCHDTGLSTEAYMAAVMAGVSLGRIVRIDVLPGGTSFAQAKDVLAGLEEKIGASLLSPAQGVLLEQMAAALERVRGLYRSSYIDVDTIPAALRRQAKIPGGAIPSTLSLFVSPLASFMEGDDEAARELLLSLMERAWEDLGKPHAVTPAAKFLAQTAAHMARRMLQDRIPLEQRVALYEGLPLALVEYWRGVMPCAPDEGVFESLCRQHLEAVLPSYLPEPEQESLRQALLSRPTDKAYARSLLVEHDLALRPEVASLFEEEPVVGWLNDVAMCDAVSSIAAVLSESGLGVSPELETLDERFSFVKKARQGQLQHLFAERMLDYEATYEAYDWMAECLEHVGHRTGSIAARRGSRLAAIKLALSQLEALGIEVGRREDVIFAALLMAHDPRNPIDMSVQKLLFTPRDAFPSEWEAPPYADPGFSTEAHQDSEFGEILREAELFWRRFAQQRFLSSTPATGTAAFMKALERVDDPNVAQLVVAQYHKRVS